jgi:hypothetical protein
LAKGVNRGTLIHTEQATVASIHRAEQSGRRLAERERSWLVPLGRAGFAANGGVYLIVGLLAAEAAIGVGGDTTDAGGVLGRIVQAPNGRIAVGVVGIGLAGYALWRLLQALLDSEHKGEDLKGLAQRAGFAIAGLTYAGLALSALAMALDRGGEPNEEQLTQDRTAWLMSQPLGPWLVVLAGAIVIGVGLAQFVEAYRGSFLEKLREQELSQDTRRLVELAGRLGYGARGVAFSLIGGFLVLAGIEAQPEEARGLGGALASLASQPFGPSLLGVVAVGLIGYGVHMLVAARYRRMVLG